MGLLNGRVVVNDIFNGWDEDGEPVMSEVRGYDVKTVDGLYAEIARLEAEIELSHAGEKLGWQEAKRFEADNERLRAALRDWKARIKSSGKRVTQCPTLYSIYCDICIVLAVEQRPIYDGHREFDKQPTEGKET